MIVSIMLMNVIDVVVELKVIQLASSADDMFRMAECWNWVFIQRHLLVGLVDVHLATPMWRGSKHLTTTRVKESVVVYEA